MAHNTLLLKINEKALFDMIGSYGPWQRRVFIAMSLVAVIGMWHSFAITFMAPNMDFWCISNSSMTVHDMSSAKNSTRKALRHAQNDSSDQCEVQLVDDEDNLSANDKRTSIPCSRWEYNTSFYSQTIVSEWNLVCDREWMVSFAKSVYMMGFLVSMILSGPVSDYIGRYPTIAICYIIVVVSSVVSILSDSFLMFVIARFFISLGRSGITTTGCVLLMEILGPDHRLKLEFLFMTSWPIGIMILPGIAWFVRHWFWYQIVTLLPYLPLIGILRIVPESPRWLLTQNRTQKFMQVVKHAAKINGRELKDEMLEPLLLHQNDAEVLRNTKKSIFDVLRRSQMRKRWLVTAFLWFVNGYVYYGLAYNTNDLGTNPYITLFLYGFIEFLAITLNFYAVNRIGRKMPLILAMMIAGIMGVAVMAVPPVLRWPITTFSMIGQFCISSAFCILYIYTIEMFPTVVRNATLSNCSAFSRIAASIAPFSRELGRSTHYTVPSAVISGLAFTAGLLACLLPETKDHKLPDTLEEGGNFGKKLDKIKI